MAYKFTEEQATELYNLYKDLGQDDLYLALANAMRYSAETKEPILGFRDDVDAIVNYLKEQTSTIIANLCRVVCGDTTAKNIFEKAHEDVTCLTAFIELLGKVTDGTDLEAITYLPDTSMILASLLIMKRGKEAVEVFCGCQ